MPGLSARLHLCSQLYHVHCMLPGLLCSPAQRHGLHSLPARHLFHCPGSLLPLSMHQLLCRLLLSSASLHSMHSLCCRHLFTGSWIQQQQQLHVLPSGHLCIQCLWVQHVLHRVHTRNILDARQGSQRVHLPGVPQWKVFFAQRIHHLHQLPCWNLLPSPRGIQRLSLHAMPKGALFKCSGHIIVPGVWAGYLQ